MVLVGLSPDPLLTELMCDDPGGLSGGKASRQVAGAGCRVVIGHADRDGASTVAGTVLAGEARVCAGAFRRVCSARSPATGVGLLEQGARVYPLSAAPSSFLVGLARRGSKRPVASAVSAALIAALGLVAGSPLEVAQAVPVKAAKAARVDIRPDLLSARVTARAQGSRVEVESERAATSSTWVNPDGTLTTEQHARAVRFRGKDGAWADVDLSMAASPDGTAGPRSHAGGLRLKGASATASGAPGSATETDVVSVSEPGKSAREVVLGWPGRVGKPVLVGERATYGEVQPGVDLVVESRRSGFEQLLVVKSAAALAGLAVQLCGVISTILGLAAAGLYYLAGMTRQAYRTMALTAIGAIGGRALATRYIARHLGRGSAAYRAIERKYGSSVLNLILGNFPAASN